MAKDSVEAIRQLRSPYTIEDVYTALRTLAFYGGNLRRATAALNESSSCRGPRSCGVGRGVFDRAEALEAAGMRE